MMSGDDQNDDSVDDTEPVRKRRRKPQIVVKQVDQFSIWERRFNQHGWPTILVVIFGFVVYRGCLWIEPRFSKWFEENNKTMEVFRQNDTDKTEQLKHISSSLRSNTGMIKEIHGVTVKKSTSTNQD